MTMPNSPIAQQALEAAKGIAASVASLAEKVETLDASNKKLTASNDELTKANQKLSDSNARQKHWLTAMAVLGCIVAAVVIGVIVALVKVNEANDKAVKASDLSSLVQQYLTQGCVQTNLDRARQKNIWDTLYAQSAQLNKQQGTKPSAAEKAALAKVLDKVKEAYPQRDCSKVKDGIVQNKDDAALVPSPAPTP